MYVYICHDCVDVIESESPIKECPVCKSDDVEEVSCCCGAAIDNNRICPDCKEHC